MSLANNPSTPGNAVGEGKSNDNGGDILKSIAALRSVLMLDTPTRAALASRVATPRRPNFTPAPPRTSRLEQQQLQQHDEGAENSPQQQLANEIERRQTLELSYDQLLKLQKQQSTQLESVTKSRQDTMEELTKMKGLLEIEKRKSVERNMQYRPQLDLLEEDLQTHQNTISQLKEENQTFKQKNEQLTSQISNPPSSTCRRTTTFSTTGTTTFSRTNPTVTKTVRVNRKGKNIIT